MFGKRTFIRKERVCAASCALVALCLALSSFSTSLDGRAVVADAGEFPAGLFAKTVGYLPGDSILVSNIAAGRTLDVLVVGSLDPSEGVAILLSPEAADALGIQKNSDAIVRVARRSGQLDEAVSGTAVIADASTSAASDGDSAVANADESGQPEIIERSDAQEDNAVAETQGEAETLAGRQDDVIAELPDAQDDVLDAPAAAGDADLENDESQDLASLPDAEDLPAQDGEAASETEAPIDEPYVADAPVSDEAVDDSRVADEPYVADAPVSDEAVDDSRVADEPYVADAPVSDEPVDDSRVADEPLVEVAESDAPAGENVVSDKVIVEYVPVESGERPAVAETQTEETDVQSEETSVAERLDDLPPDPFAEADEQVAESDAPAGENVVSDKVIVEYLPAESKEEPVVAETPLEEAVAESDGQVADADAQAEENVAAAERFDADAPAELDGQTEEIAEETQGDAPLVETFAEDLPPLADDAAVEESVAETPPAESETLPAVAEADAAERFGAEDLPPLADDAAVEESVAETPPAESETLPALAEADAAERFSAEDLPPLADDAAVGEVVAEDAPVEDAPALAERSEETEAPPADDDGVYEAIVLEPAPNAPPYADGSNVPAEDAILVERTDAVAETPAVPADGEEIAALETPQPAGSASLPSDLSRYVVRDISSLEQGKYYVQIAALADSENIRDTVSKYGADYPLVLVPIASGRTVQVMIGPLGVDEYGVVMERFKSYGFADAFLRQNN